MPHESALLIAGELRLEGSVSDLQLQLTVTARPDIETRDHCHTPFPCGIHVAVECTPHNLPGALVFAVHWIQTMHLEYSSEHALELITFCNETLEEPLLSKAISRQCCNKIRLSLLITNISTGVSTVILQSQHTSCPLLLCKLTQESSKRSTVLPSCSSDLHWISV